MIIRSEFLDFSEKFNRRRPYLNYFEITVIKFQILRIIGKMKNAFIHFIYE